MSEDSGPIGDEWRSPRHIVERAREFFGGAIDLDPASTEEANSEIVKATTFYTREVNGIEQPWHGKVWLNPPYSKVNGISQAEAFLAKFKYEHEEGRMEHGIILTNVCTGSRWFEGMWELTLCFVQGRLHFTHPTLTSDAPRYDNVIGYLGTEIGAYRFAQFFRKYGHINPPEPRWKRV